MNMPVSWERDGTSSHFVPLEWARYRQREGPVKEKRMIFREIPGDMTEGDRWCAQPHSSPPNGAYWGVSGGRRTAWPPGSRPRSACSESLPTGEWRETPTG